MPTDLEVQSSDLVVYAARLLRAVRRQIGQPPGLRILALLDELGATAVTQLADADRSSQPTMSGAVRQLEEQGYVQRSSDASDARRSVVALTPAGRRRLTEARRVNGAAVAERLARTGHSVEDVEAAVTLLRDVLAAPLDVTSP